MSNIANNVNYNASNVPLFLKYLNAKNTPLSNLNGYVEYISRKDIIVAGFKNFPMFDWDIPDEAHKCPDCITIEKREDVLPWVIQAHKDFGVNFILEQTPGGVRGWLDQAVTGDEWADLATDLNCDPYYVSITLRECAWRARISPKPNRAGDYVAKYWGNIGDVSEATCMKYNEYRSLIQL
jgi:hypothetical protein